MIDLELQKEYQENVRLARCQKIVTYAVVIFIILLAAFLTFY